MPTVGRRPMRKHNNYVYIVMDTTKDMHVQSYTSFESAISAMKAIYPYELTVEKYSDEILLLINTENNLRIRIIRCAASGKN